MATATAAPTSPRTAPPPSSPPPPSPQRSSLRPAAPRTGLAGRPTVRRALKRTLWVTIALAVAIGIALGLRPSRVAVETAAVARGTLRITVDEDGRTRVVDRYTITAPLAAMVARPALRAGDSVRQGEIVARLVPVASPLLDPRSRAQAEARVAAAQAALSQAGAQVASAAAAAEFAAREAARQRVLGQGGAVSRQSVEQADLTERTAREALASAQFGERVTASEVRLARAALARLDRGTAVAEEFPVRAPVRGVLLRVIQESEAVVPAGAPLMEVGDPASLEAVVDVLTTDAVDIRPGAPVRLERWGGDAALNGYVHRVEPSAFTRLSALGVEEQRVNVIVRPAAPRSAWAVLGDGFRVEASILTWEGRNRLIVPGGAVFRQGSGWAVYVVDGGRARLRTIEIGRRNDSEVEVVRGLREGDRVVIYPTDNVGDGVRVAVE